MINFATILLVVAVILFALGAWSRWWGTAADPRGPYYGAFICAGLFFLSLSMLWPLVIK